MRAKTMISAEYVFDYRYSDLFDRLPREVAAKYDLAFAIFTFGEVSEI